MQRNTGNRQERLAALAFATYVAGLKALPVRARLSFAGWTTRRVLAPLLGYHERADSNLKHVWPDLRPERRRQIADQAIDNLGRALIENYDPREMLARGAAYPVTGAGLPLLEKARAEGRPVLLLSGHYGSPICARTALITRGYEIGAMLRAMSNPYMNDRYVANYGAVGEPVFVQGRRGTMGLLRHLRSGGMAAMLFDVYDSSGVPMPFLGQPAPTVTSPADMALKTGALLIPYFGIRRPDRYGFDTIIEEPIPHGDPIDMMHEATRRLEARIVEDPGQWMWTHRRWKPERQRRRQRNRAAAKIGP